MQGSHDAVMETSLITCNCCANGKVDNYEEPRWSCLEWLEQKKHISTQESKNVTRVVVLSEML
jgi:hypothetical protein